MRIPVQPVLTRAWGNRVCLLAFAAALLFALLAVSAGAEEPRTIRVSSRATTGSAVCDLTAAIDLPLLGDAGNCGSGTRRQQSLDAGVVHVSLH